MIEEVQKLMVMQEKKNKRVNVKDKKYSRENYLNKNLPSGNEQTPRDVVDSVIEEECKQEDVSNISASKMSN